MFGGDLCLDYDPDEVSALAARRDTQWSKLQNTNFLTINEKRHAIGYGPIEGGDVLGNSENLPPAPPSNRLSLGPDAWGAPKFNPNHDPDNGQFTFGSGGGDDEPDDSGDDGGGGDNAPDTSPIEDGDFGPGVFGLPKRPERGTPTGAGSEDDESYVDEGIDPLAEAKIAMYESAAGTLRELDPDNPLLTELRNPDGVPTPEDTDRIHEEIANVSRQHVMDFLMPDGKPVGMQGNGRDIRIVFGNFSTAQRDFEPLIIGGETLDLPDYNGIMVRLPGNGGLIGLRPSSSDGLPTMDVKIPSVPFRSIHYK